MTHTDTRLIKAVNKYPSSLNIFHLGTGFTAYIGVLKVATILWFSNSCIVQAPTLDLGETTSLLWAPLSVVISALPMIAVQLVTSPVTNSINVLLPPGVAKTDQSLRDWSSNPPGNTLIEFTTLRFLPFPKRKTVRLEDLRMLPRGKGWRIAQFEYVPPILRANTQGKPLSWIKRFVGGRRTFYVREGTKFTRSTRGPGVWSSLVDVILRHSGHALPKDNRQRMRAAHRPTARRSPPGQTG